MTGIDCPSLPCHVTTSWAHWLKIQKITLVRFSSQIEIKICIQKRLCSITTLFSVWKLLKRRCWLKLKIQSTAKLFPLEKFWKEIAKRKLMIRCFYYIIVEHIHTEEYLWNSSAFLLIVGHCDCCPLVPWLRYHPGQREECLRWKTFYTKNFHIKCKK